MKKLLVLFTALCLVFCLVACNGGENNVSTEPTETTAPATTAETTEAAAFVEVKVIDEKENPVSGVMLQICKDTCIPMVTDENGIAKFNIEPTGEHKLSVLSCPEGYVYNGEPEMHLVDGVTEYTVSLDFV